MAAAVVPQCPLLLPGVGPRAGEAARLRALAAAAVATVAGAAVDQLRVVGTVRADEVQVGPAAYAPTARRAGGPEPLAVSVASWLLAQAGYRGEVAFELLAPDAAAAGAGAELARRTPNLGLIVVADGSACRGEDPPRPPDPGAAAFDEVVGHALATGDGPALLALDAAAARRYQAGGWAAWQLLGGAAGETALAASLDYCAAPFGVGYFVARWAAAPAGSG